MLKLTPTPPANAFVDAKGLNREQATFPLDVVDPELLFADYVYVSGTSPVFVKHFEEYANSITKRFAPDSAGGLVVDIGSNDGTLLAQFKELGFGVLGVDPAREIARQATENGIETWPEFFTADLAGRILAERGTADIVTANNVFAHADDLAGITQGVKSLMAPSGVFVFEVSYLVDVFEKTLFDTIYHEHLAYHSVKPLRAFFASAGMELISAERVASHGGSLRSIVQLADGPHDVDASVQASIDYETRMGLDRAETLLEFGTQINTVKRDLTALLWGLKKAGKSIAGFGAPAKATTLMYHFGIGSDLIDFIVDDSPLKQGLFSPGMHIPVLPSDAIYSKKPDAVVVLAWNFAEPIMRNHARYRDEGGQFIVPLPSVEVFD